MKKRIVTILLVIVIVLVLVIAGALGFVWYRDNHVFVEGDAYPISSTRIDLREQDVTESYYLELQQALPQCEILWNVPFQNGKLSSDSQTITVSNLTEDDARMLQYFPNLKILDATSGPADMNYALLESLANEKPEWDVRYEVDLGGKRVAPEETELALYPEEYDPDILGNNLVYLRQLTELTLHTPAMTEDAISALKEAHPEITILCTAEILGTEYDTDTTELDLSAMTDTDVEEVASQLSRLPNLTYVNLNPEDGNGTLSKEAVRQLMEAAPDVVFEYSFDFFGQTLSTAQEEVVLTNVKIGDENESEIRLALDLLGNCQRFVLDNCRMSDEVMEQLRNDYRDRTKVVWRVWFGGGSSLTDAEVIRCTYDLVDDNCHDLVYCEDVRFVDFGHNEWLDGCDFISGMVNLEYCILSGAPIKSLEPFANCKNLKFLEIAFCEYIEDLSPLANCENLQMLNISNTHALDLSPLDNLDLTHFCARLNPSGKSRISAEEQARFVEQHPDCWSSFDGAQPYGVGWRYDEDEITPLEHYTLLGEAFQYPHSPNNTGWYLS